MKDFLLRARHFLIFIPLIIPTLISFYFQYLYFGWISSFQQQALRGDGDPADLLSFDFSAAEGPFLIYLALFGLAMATQVGWWYSVSTGLREYLPTGTNLKPKRFRIAFVVAIVYIVTVLAGQYFAFGWVEDFLPTFLEAASSGTEPDFGDPSVFISRFLMVWAIVMVLGLAGIASMIYLAYYSGKTLKCVEEQKPLRGSSVAGYSVLSYFLVIGVWILQPKIHRLLETGTMKDPKEDIWEVK